MENLYKPHTHSAQRKTDVQVKIKEQEVLQYELSSLRPKAKVYRQQQNSNILFLSTMEQEMQCAKQNLDSLQKEYQEAESATAEDEQAAEEEETEKEQKEKQKKKEQGKEKHSKVRS